MALPRRSSVPRNLAIGALIVIAMATLAGLVLLASGPVTSTSLTTLSSSASSSTSSPGFHSTVSSSGLELRVDLNATTVESGGAIGAQIAVFNSLDQNLSLVPNYSAGPSISDWRDYDFFCGGSGNPLTSMVGFALFNGNYSAGNINLAGSPLELVPPVGVSCVTYARPGSITFLPENDTAVFFGPPYQNGTPYHITIGATTESCTNPAPGTYGCGAGKGLFGYWVTPGITPGLAGFSDQDGVVGSKYFRFFPAGAYTLVVQDIWGHTIYAHFQVTPAPGHPVEVVSVEGPIPPYNPGGPVVSITLRNIGDSPVTSLNASLPSQPAGPKVPYSFVFNVSSSAPMLPGQTKAETRTLIGASIDSSLEYPLTIRGTLLNGTQFSYEVQVQVLPPA